MSTNSQEDERWRIIPDFERYSVSDRGNVRNDWTGRPIRPRISNHGTNKHAKVLLSFAGRKKDLFVHRLVAEAFIRPLCEGEIVNHINGKQTDNRIENLEICDASENTRHAVRLRAKISRLEVVFLPITNHFHNGLFVSIGPNADDDLLTFLKAKGFECLRCNDRTEARLLIEDYMAS